MNCFHLERGLNEMALLNNNHKEKNEKKPIKASEIVIKDDVSIKYTEKPKYSAKERKPVQVDPPVLKMISCIAYAKDIPMYEVVRLAVESYLKELPESERLIYERKSNA